MTASHIDAYVVVFSVEDRRSFEAAIDRLYEIRDEEVARHVTLILVANKTDLVRTRVVPEDGRLQWKEVAGFQIDIFDEYMEWGAVLLTHIWGRCGKIVDVSDKRG